MVRASVVLALGVLLTSRWAGGDDPPAGIAWESNLTKALEEAATSKRPLFIAVNNVTVEGEGVEVASKLLREHVYTDPGIIERSKAFVCVLVRSPVNSEDGGELRSRFDIDDLIVSPQHLLVHADGTLIQRKEYWEHREAPASVEALGAMMARALKAHEVRQTLAPLAADPASRPAWMRAALDLVRSGLDIELRKAAARALADADVEGDCLGALGSLLLEVKDPKKEEIPALVEVACLLGRPQLEVAVPALSTLLDEKDAALRGNAAVSLEYVGSLKAVEAIQKQLSKEKDEAVHSNLLRALGRCGAKDDSVRKTLLREALARSDLVAAGAIIGLAYFEGDADAARGLEKSWKGGDEGIRPVATLLALVEIHDPRTADFLQAQLAAAARLGPGARLLGAALSCFVGQGDARKAELVQGLGWAMREKYPGSGSIRAPRGPSEFVPKGDPAPR